MFNRFGVEYTDVTELFPNVSASDMGGQTVIENVIDRAVNRIAARLPDRVMRLLNYRVEYEILAGPAFGGEGPTFTLGLGPVASGDTGKLKIYVVSGNTDGSKPEICPGFNSENLTGSLGGTNNQTLTLTGTTTTLTEGQYLLATYVIDPEDSEFTLTSYADYVVYSSAYEIGSKLFYQEIDGWKLVDEYKELAEAYMNQLESNGFVDVTIRNLEFCNEIEPGGSQIGYARLGRG